MAEEVAWVVLHLVSSMADQEWAQCHLDHHMRVDPVQEDTALDPTSTHRHLVDPQDEVYHLHPVSYSAVVVRPTTFRNDLQRSWTLVGAVGMLYLGNAAVRPWVYKVQR